MVEIFDEKVMNAFATEMGRIKLKVLYWRQGVRSAIGKWQQYWKEQKEIRSRAKFIKQGWKTGFGLKCSYCDNPVVKGHKKNCSWKAKLDASSKS